MSAPMPETIAERIKRATAGARACNYDGGAFTDSAGRWRAPLDGAGARCLAHTRNREGRCNRALYVYADGSALQFRWGRHAGPVVETFKPGQALFIRRGSDGCTLYYRAPFASPIARNEHGPHPLARFVMLDCVRYPALRMTGR